MFVFYQSDLGDGIAIAYIDVKDGLCDGHIRCMDAHSAKLIVSQNMDGFGFTLVSGKFLYQRNKMSQCMRFPTMWYVRPAKPQVRLRIRAD